MTDEVSRVAFVRSFLGGNARATRKRRPNQASHAPVLKTTRMNIPGKKRRGGECSQQGSCMGRQPTEFAATS